jgi:Domain of unknown function (DUF6362)
MSGIATCHLPQHYAEGAQTGVNIERSHNLAGEAIALAKHGAYLMVTLPTSAGVRPGASNVTHLKPPLGDNGLSPKELQVWLEWAGSKLLALNVKSPLPKEPSCAWPEFKQDATQAYGYTNERLRPPQPTALDIELMDRILVFPSLIKDIDSRRIVNARALVTPLGNRYLYSWSKIAFMLHTNRQTVRRLHNKGLCEIIPQIAKEKVDAIRLLLGHNLT